MWNNWIDCLLWEEIRPLPLVASTVTHHLAPWTTWHKFVSAQGRADQGWGVIIQFSYFRLSHFFRTVRAPVFYWISHSYFTGVAAGRRRCKLSNSSMMQRVWNVILQNKNITNGEINKWGIINPHLWTIDDLLINISRETASIKHTLFSLSGVVLHPALLAPAKYYHLLLSGLILGLPPANERRRYLVTASLIGWVQA